MRLTKSSQTCLLSVAVCLIVPDFARAQDKIRLTLKSVVGDVAQMQEDFRMDAVLTVTAAGASHPTTLRYGSHQTEVYQESLLSKNASGRRDAVRRVYTVYRESIKKDSAEKQDAKGKTTTSPLQGRTVVIQRKGRGVVVTSSGGKLPKDIRRQLEDALEDEPGIVPDYAVAIGEEWEVDPKKLARMSLFKSDKDAVMKVKWLEVVPVDGHRCARLRVNMRFKMPVKEGVDSQSELNGDMYLALDIERILRVNLQGPFTYTGSRAGDEDMLNGFKGTTSVNIVMRWQKIAAKPIKTDKP